MPLSKGSGILKTHYIFILLAFSELDSKKIFKQGLLQRLLDTDFHNRYTHEALLND